MKSDIANWTFDPGKQFSRVLLQQGRVQLDADWNEQTAILLHSLRTLTEDLIGPFGAPANPDGTPGDGFRLASSLNQDGNPESDRFSLLPGRYYVGGIAVENPRQELLGAAGSLLSPQVARGKTYLIYLDVWERHVTYIQDDSIREVALGGPDTATRAQVTWRVRADSKKADGSDFLAGATCLDVRREWALRVAGLQPARRGKLKAQARRDPAETDLCTASPEARYTGENQLYRVEIHKAGTAAGGATFKWSRENGSVVFPIRSLAASPGVTTVTLEHMGRDQRFGLAAGDRVELLGDDADFQDEATLLEVTAVDPDRSRVTLKGSPLPGERKHPFLRRWDQRERKASPLKDGAVAIQEGQWLDLEDGVQVWFERDETLASPHRYRSGDYWLIPARVTIGDVVWPQEKGPDQAEVPRALSPHGVEHRYAPLGLVTVASDGTVTIKDCRRTFGARSLLLDTGRADWILTGLPPSLPALTEPRPADIVTKMHSKWSRVLPARWISVQPNQVDGTLMPTGSYTYELHLGSCVHGALLSLRLLADNSARVLLNDHPLGTHQDTRPGQVRGFEIDPTSMDTAQHPEFFLPGEDNVLKVIVMNAEPLSPTGFVLSGTLETDDGLCCCSSPSPRREQTITVALAPEKTPESSPQAKDDRQPPAVQAAAARRGRGRVPKPR
jgi:hypothetical protein